MKIMTGLSYKNLVLLSLISFFCIACDSGICESFNFKRIPFDSNFYKENLMYTNGYDTLDLSPIVVECSRESNLNPMANPECNPSFTIEYSPQINNKLDILYSFMYRPEDIKTEFTFIICSSELRLKINSQLTNGKKIVFDNFDHLNTSDSSRMIKRATLQSMRIIEIETYSGIKWNLVVDK